MKFNGKKAASAITAAAALMFAVSRIAMLIRVSGGSMYPTFRSGDLLLCLKCTSAQRGDIVAFRYNGMILVKRVTAVEGDITLIGVVPKDSLFVTGDASAVSIDSRNGIGFVRKSDIVGKVVLRRAAQ